MEQAEAGGCCRSVIHSKTAHDECRNYAKSLLCRKTWPNSCTHHCFTDELSRCFCWRLTEHFHQHHAKTAVQSALLVYRKYFLKLSLTGPSHECQFLSNAQMIVKSLIFIWSVAMVTSIVIQIIINYLQYTPSDTNRAIIPLPDLLLNTCKFIYMVLLWLLFQRLSV